MLTICLRHDGIWGTAPDCSTCTTPDGHPVHHVYALTTEEIF
jgi:hypothetical protein